MTATKNPTTNLEKGIYYEPAKKRYRVRLYRNNCVHAGGYYHSYLKALDAWKKLKHKLNEIPKDIRHQKTQHPIHRPTIEGLSTALQEEQFRNPKALRIGKK